MSSGLTAEPLRQYQEFNWVYLVELLVCSVLTVFFLFYFNRLFATLVSYAIRAYTWHKYHVYVDVQALQISLLAGRIFFKDIRYHGDNQTILVHGGYITWQYWLRNVQDTDVFSPKTNSVPRSRSSSPDAESHCTGRRSRSLGREEKGGIQDSKPEPCRIAIKVSGVEVFLYNRSPVYDSILSNIAQSRGRRSGQGNQDSSEDERGSDSPEKSSLGNTRPETSAGLTDGEKRNSRPLQEDLKHVVDPPTFLKLFPIHVDCNKGAVALGNEHTTSVLTAQFERISGEFNATQAGPLDIYRQLFNFEVIHPVIHMRKNSDFKSLQLAAAARLKTDAEDGELKENVSDNSGKPAKSRLRPRSLLSAFWSSSTTSINMPTWGLNGRKEQSQTQPAYPGQEKWQGLARYIHDSQNDVHDEWDGIEYGKASLIVDCPKIRMSFYWDLPGPVAEDASASQHLPVIDDINGTYPPAYGMDLQVFGGTVNYGPWADRQRMNLQNVFFPPSHVDATPTERLASGATRLLTVFKVFVSVEEDTTLRIPIREPSKDWKWKGKASNLTGKPDSDSKEKSRTRPRVRPGRKKNDNGIAATVRPYAWLDIKVLADSTINYDMDMVARGDGYHNRLDVDLRGAEIFSSVNHGLLWRCGRLTLDSSMAAPLAWNALRTWTFAIKITELDLFILRDHLFLVTDLVTDWGSGGAPDYFTFTPFQYLLTFEFENFKIYLNTNDSNIVNNPSDIDENNFIVLSGHHLRGEVTIPLDRYRPSQNEIPFDVCGHDLGLNMCMPSRNTLHTLVRSKHVARLGELTLRGSHTYHTTTAPGLTDRLHFDINGSNFSLVLFGFLIRHLMKIKDNYFGDDLHFKTLEEYQHLQPQTTTADAPEARSEHHNTSNDLDVILCITASECSALLPSKLYSVDHGIRIEIPYASADLRFTNYYMDLETNFSPLSMSLGSFATDLDTIADTVGSTEIYVASANIMGHRLFGLPPTEPTYVCNWDFAVGDILGECSSHFLQALASGIRCFAFSLDDDENALPVLNPLIIHDVTFLRLNTSLIQLWVHIENEAIMINTQPLKLEFHDWASATFSQRLKVNVPNVTLACVDGTIGSRSRLRDGYRHTAKTYAFLDTSVSLSMLKRNLHFDTLRQAQQDHIHEHDKRTTRTNFLLRQNEIGPSDNLHISVDPPALVFPAMPLPIRGHGSSFRSSVYNASITSSSMQKRAASKCHRSALSHSRSSQSLSESLHSTRQTMHHVHRDWSQGSGPNSTAFLDKPVFVDIVPGKKGSSPSSFALASSLAPPYFPMHHIDPDMSIMEPLHAGDDYRRISDKSNPVQLSTPQLNLDQDMVHTSFVVSTGSGVRVFCTPQAITTAANILRHITPSHPESCLDTLQVSALTTILDSKKREQGKGKSVEVSLSMPQVHIRFENHTPSAIEHLQNPQIDQYDVQLFHPVVLLRSKTLPDSSTSFSVHTKFTLLDVAVKPLGAGVPADKAAVSAQVRDFLLWISKAKANCINLTLRSLEIATATENVGHLSSLLQRTISRVEAFDAHFRTMKGDHDKRLRLLVYSLTNAGKDVPDPPFLTRASYVGRVGAGHLRNQDSWKILSRLRYIYLQMTKEQKEGLIRTCQHLTPICPANAPEEIISMWDRWRAWDLRSVKRSLVMQQLYGPFQGESTMESRVELPLHVDVRTSQIRLAIDPGPKQSELVTQLLSLSVVSEVPLPPSGLHLVENESRNTTVHVNSRDLLATVNWEICDLLDDVLTLFRAEPQRSEGGTVKQLSEPETASPQRDHNFQFVLTMDSATINVDCINAFLACSTQKAQFSVAGYDRRRSKTDTLISIVSHAESSGIDLRSRSKALLHTEAKAAIVHASYQADQGGVSGIQAGAMCKVVMVDIGEELLGLIEVSDAVLRDEIPYINGLMRKFKPSQSSFDTGRASFRLPKLTMALLMDSYFLDITILPSLVYSISGGLGRMSVSPSTVDQTGLTFDFDLDEHCHKLISRDAQDSTAIASFPFPPVNGRLKMSGSEDHITLYLVGTVRLIVLEASAINALMNLIKTDEISHLFHSVQHDISVIQDHLQDMFPDRKETSNPPKDLATRSIVYQVQLSLAGVQVIAKAPTQFAASSTADLVFGIEHANLKIVSNPVQDGRFLDLPDISAEIGRVGLTLALSGEEMCQRCGNVTLGANIHITSDDSNATTARRVIRVFSSGLDVNIYATTASAIVDVMNHLQDKLKDVDLSKEKRYLQRLRQYKNQRSSPAREITSEDVVRQGDTISSGVFTSIFSLELLNIQISWVVAGSSPVYTNRVPEDLVLSFRRINLSTRTEDAARLMIEDMQLQMVPPFYDKRKRSLNSALLPEVVFNVAYSSSKEERKLLFHAAGKSLDLQLESKFVVPAKCLEQSIALAVEQFRTATTGWQKTPTATGVERKKPFGNKRLSSLQVDADFAGAVVHLRAASYRDLGNASESIHSVGTTTTQKGRYEHFSTDGSTASTSLRAPGVALKVEYRDDGKDPSLSAELKVDASNNALYPTVVPLIVDISNSIKDVVKDKDSKGEDEDQLSKSKSTVPKLMEEDSIITADPSTILGKTRLNFGFRICKQEFSLSCQPIARVAATACLDDMYMTMSSVKTKDQGNFFAISGTFERLQASVQHVYSKESTFSFNVDSINLSLMNSKHLSGKSGMSAILNINPTRTQVNARQLQDFLLFREIWVPPEVRQQASQSTSVPASEPQEYLVQRYHQVASAAAFPWNATVAIAEMTVELDLGQAIGKSSLTISNMWASSKKRSDWEQNLCVGVDRIEIDSNGRMNGTIELSQVKIRTSIRWPEKEDSHQETPFIQASAGFNSLRVKVGFDYQVFAAADISDFEFMMYNVRQGQSRDRLVAILDGDRVQVFLTSTSSAQAVALYQAVQRLIQENQSAYMQSLKDIERFMRRKSSTTTRPSSQPSTFSKTPKDDTPQAPISLGTDVVVTLKKLTFGAFPNSLSDSQVLSLEASDAQARFAAALVDDPSKGVQVHSVLGLTLGHLSVALASISSQARKDPPADLSVESILGSVASAKGGTILRVPRVLATMQTWQSPGSNGIEYHFKSSFEGKVDVGWNYSRISYIRNMWSSHTRALASRLGKPLPEPAVKISASRQRPEDSSSGEREKITAVVNVPVSRYEYTPLGEVIIETPQLRDMGDATPPLEWIGLHRDRLPNITHQIVIVPLLEIAKEVEDAYGRILGSS